MGDLLSADAVLLRVGAPYRCASVDEISLVVTSILAMIRRSIFLFIPLYIFIVFSLIQSPTRDG